MGLWNALRRSILTVAAATAVVAASLASAPSARAEEQKDDRLGYSFTYPRKWNKQPISADERWIVAKFSCDREFEDADPKTNYWSRHRPWIDVVVIPLVREAPKPSAGDKPPSEPAAGPPATPPYTNLKEYLDRTYRSNSGGFVYTKEEDLKVGTYRCLQYELTFDSQERFSDGPKRIFAWAFHTDDAIYGFVGETLIKFEDKVKPDLLAAFKTFKAFPRTGKLAGDAPAGDDALGGGKKAEDLDDDGRMRLREQKTTLRLMKIKETLGSDWTVKETEHFIAVSHSDAKHTKSVLDHCEALREWMDKNLGYVGSGYAGRIIVRICKDQNENEAFRKTAGYGQDNIEVVTFKDRDGWSDWSMTSLNGGVYEIWKGDKNAALDGRMPRWLDSGLKQVVEHSKSKGKAIEFPPGVWGSEEVNMARRAGKLVPAKSFFTMKGEDLWNWDSGGVTIGFGSLSASQQSEFFVRYLLVGGARKSAKYKTLFSDYVKAIVFLIDEEQAAIAKAARAAKQAAQDAPPPDPNAPPPDPAVLEAQRKARAEAFAATEGEFLAKLMQRVFADWTDKDWDALNAAYVKDLD